MADGFLDRLKDAAFRLGKSPHIGVSRNNLIPGLRVLFHAGYGIYYVIRPANVVIIRVIHQARDAAAQLSAK